MSMDLPKTEDKRWQKKFPLAIAILNEKLLSACNIQRLNDEAVKELYSFGYTLYQKDLFSQAVEVFLYLLLTSKPDAKIFMAIAACCQAQSDFRNAVLFYQCCIDFGYTDPAAHLYLGECLLRMNRKSEALVHFRSSATKTRDLEDQADIFRKSIGLIALIERLPAARTEE